MTAIKSVLAAVLICAATSPVNAKDMFYALASRWCSTEWNNKLEKFEITEQGRCAG